MSSKSFYVHTKNLIVLMAFSYFVIMAGALGIFNHVDNAKFLLFLGIMVYFVFWLIVMLEIVNSHIENKIFWILLMILFSGVVPIVYLLVRNKVMPKGVDMV